ncbi:hypothetical protein MSHO_20250 [Mycobacterium shottsii]|uniref:Uncharacterized protein n=1 Tax=Mycobacterium shottsii TaxID=133549 RepID=A0A7I7LAL3_9MYCO|nr:hypothetical protein MSHO_20250 [Mycobacterium shottsii]
MQHAKGGPGGSCHRARPNCRPLSQTMPFSLVSSSATARATQDGYPHTCAANPSLGWVKPIGLGSDKRDDYAPNGRRSDAYRPLSA